MRECFCSTSHGREWLNSLSFRSKYFYVNSAKKESIIIPKKDTPFKFETFRASEFPSPQDIDSFAPMDGEFLLTFQRAQQKRPVALAAQRAVLESSLRSDNNPGSDLRSHTVTRAVSSALRGLTSVFGMGTGVTPAVWPPGKSMSKRK